jgi:hypothetical protein
MFSYRIDDETSLRLNEERHAEASYALIDRNREHLRLWLPWATESFSLEDTHNYIKQNPAEEK